MNRTLFLNPEARHHLRAANLDALEDIVRTADKEIEIASAFEEIFLGLDGRPQISPETVLQWGQRYIAWANSLPERDGLPFLGTEWAKRMLEIATFSKKPDLALSVTNAILNSYAPLEKEQRWWMKQRYNLTHHENA